MENSRRSGQGKAALGGFISVRRPGAHMFENFEVNFPIGVILINIFKRVLSLKLHSIVSF